MAHPISLWRQRTWRCLALLCCAVVLSQSVPNLTASAPLVTADADAESEDSAPSRDDDDDGDGETGLVSSSAPLRCRSSFRRLCLAVLRHNRVAHLPHHHNEPAGFHLPVCTPFARG